MESLQEVLLVNPSGEGTIASDRCLEAYLREIDEVPLLSVEEEIHLGRKVQEGNSEAREHMIRANLRLVVSVAKRFRNRGLTLPDLIAEGNIGLLKGVEKFDPEAGFRLSTYATWWIQQTIRRALINSVKTVRVPSYMVEILTKWNRVSTELKTDLGHNPSPIEVADQIGLSAKNTKVVQQTLRGQEAPPTVGSEGLHAIPGQHREHNRDRKTPEEIVMHEDALRTLRDILELIDPLEAAVLRLRYGLDDQDPATLEKVSKSLGVSRERVRQIERHTLRKLHAYVVEGAPPEQILPSAGRRAGSVGKTGDGHKRAQ
ncbi:MAG: sigma-70 family RNA polymerase sigma factor [Planctomycetota bacterium]|jgi:RNA polymerase primary sigma factor